MVGTSIPCSSGLNPESSQSGDGAIDGRLEEDGTLETLGRLRKAHFWHAWPCIPVVCPSTVVGWLSFPLKTLPLGALGPADSANGLPREEISHHHGRRFSSVLLPLGKLMMQ